MIMEGCFGIFMVILSLKCKRNKQTWNPLDHLASMDLVAEGMFGRVYSKDGKSYRVLQCRGKAAKARARSEYEALRALRRRSGSVVQAEGFFEKGDQCCMALEECWGTLQDLLDLSADENFRWEGATRGIREGEALSMFRDMVDAVAQCHGTGVVHQGITLGNFLVTTPSLERQSSIKLVDLTLAATVDDRGLAALQGYTPGYDAPELSSETCGLKSDIFALGVCLSELLDSRHMPWADAHFTLAERGKGCWADISQETRDLVKAMLQPKPRDRPTAAEIQKLLVSHPKLLQWAGPKRSPLWRLGSFLVRRVIPLVPFFARGILF